MRNLMFIILFGVAASTSVYAQSKKQKVKKQKKETITQPQGDNAFAPANAGEAYRAPEKAARNKKKTDKPNLRAFNKRMDKKVDEFWELMEANVKANKKKAKAMEKPQYSDPMYFGHKKKPKKRAVDKRKFCKECGMVH